MTDTTRAGEIDDSDVSQLIYDWNSKRYRGPVIANRAFELHDETLRDGIQNPSVVDPEIEDKLEILHMLEEIGVDTIDVGLPGAGQRAFNDVLRLCREIADQKMNIRPTCAGRTLVQDIAPMVEVSQRAGLPIEVMTFIGSSPIRGLAEDWSVELIRRRSVEAIAFGVKEGLPVNYVTEDTTRSRPDVLWELFRAAIDHGASRLTLCDTVGHVTPDGVRNLVQFTRHLIDASGAEVGVDWHGHNDRGLGVVNAIWALEFGADRTHGTILGIGERVGNASLDQILVNLKLLGVLGDRDLTKLNALCEKVATSTEFPIPINYPVFGEDAFRTGTGVHAAAIIKAMEKGDAFLADHVYSGVPAGDFGREQEIGIGPMSGISNVRFWCRKRDVEPTEAITQAILAKAKESKRLMTDEEIHAVIASC
ncbi:MAG: LeuA family protein [Sandaracinaceae bacterium]|nr:MAG: 2-isopropylmalate synthase [Sandaracinaceae bacterium]HBQ20058.1 2-isopropylmalate synthase [Myxococcales bacterium]